MICQNLSSAPLIDVHVDATTSAAAKTTAADIGNETLTKGKATNNFFICSVIYPKITKKWLQA